MVGGIQRKGAGIDQAPDVSGGVHGPQLNRILRGTQRVGEQAVVTNGDVGTGDAARGGIHFPQTDRCAGDLRQMRGIVSIRREQCQLQRRWIGGISCSGGTIGFECKSNTVGKGQHGRVGVGTPGQHG